MHSKLLLSQLWCGSLRYPSNCMQTCINHTLWPFNHIISWKNFQGNNTDKYQTYLRHIPGYTHIRKILQKNYKILEIMQTHLQSIKDTTIQKISETPEISEVWLHYSNLLSAPFDRMKDKLFLFRNDDKIVVLTTDLMINGTLFYSVTAWSLK